MTRQVKHGAFKRSCRRCGWTGTYVTAGRADHAKRRHACERRIDKAQRSAAYAERMANVDRTPKACTHPQADHQHGTYACYTLDKCRCEPCSVAVTEYERNRTRQHAYGRWDNLVDAEPARRHVRALMEQGMGWKRIGEKADVGGSSLSSLLFGRPRTDGSKRPPAQRIRKDIAERLLAVELDLADGARVDATGTRRRLQALVAMGYSIASLGRELGIWNIHALVAGSRTNTMTLKANADAVKALYDRLSMTPNNPTEWRASIAASRARSTAKAHGWPPPLEWDDDFIDDPTYAPLTQRAERRSKHEVDEVLVESVLGGERHALTRAERFEVVRRAREAGWSYLDIESRAGISKPERYLPTEQAEVAS